jgi:hypothetical protein
MPLEHTLPASALKPIHEGLCCIGWGVRAVKDATTIEPRYNGAVPTIASWYGCKHQVQHV